MKGLSLNKPMVKAWMEGRKTVTRRLMNPQPEFNREYHGIEPCHFSRTGWAKTRCENDGMKGCSCIPVRVPYLPDETVYIKETWAVDKKYNHLPPSKIPIDGRKPVYYSAVDYGEIINYANIGRWRSPRFMPEWAARSHALIVSVRPEKLNSMTESDVVKEGVDTLTTFMLLWDQIHKGGLIWEKNPWVWAITLERYP